MGLIIQKTLICLPVIKKNICMRLEHPWGGYVRNINICIIIIIIINRSDTCIA